MRQIDELNNLLREIHAAGLSVRRVCFAVGMDPACVSRWKAGRVEPRGSSLARLRQGLHQIRGAAS